MKINYIKYHNYRCFEDVTINFNTTKAKNISLVNGVVGSGKTEMLFSFQWVLYGFDFKSMREKEETPYSINSSIYHRLSISKNAPSEDCWVELCFTYKDTTYYMKRVERFFQKNGYVDSLTHVSLSHEESNGERSIPETDPEIVEETLSRIIPKTILEGITFDGERMKKLSISDDSAQKTIEGVIELVTNEKLFSLCLGEIKHVKDDVSSEKRKINKASGNNTAGDLEEEISNLEDIIDNNETALFGVNNTLAKIERELDEVSFNLTQLEEARKLEEKRKGLEKDLEKAKKTFSKNIESFAERLSDGYFLITDQLAGDVRQSVENVDVPSGLTVEAVLSIMKRPKCICGCDITDDVKLHLRDMLSTLPPDNISSTILYMANQFKDDKKRTLKLLKECYKEMHDSENEVAQLKLDLSNISTKLIGNVSDKVSKLEERRTTLHEQKGRINRDKDRYELEISNAKKRLISAKKELADATGNQEAILSLIAQQEVLEKFKDAIKLIEDKNQKLSLLSINDYLSKAFSLISEDVGRCVYICQYEKRDRYRLVTYVKKQYDERFADWTNKGKIITYQQEGFSLDEIKEKIILEITSGKSTGQSKTNSLAFAKAILDYSNADRGNDNLNVSHDYPFLIDSPFTELSGGNLTKIAEHIYTFANQIILMADDNSYKDVEKFVSPHVNSKTYLSKDLERGITYIKD